VPSHKSAEKRNRQEPKRRLRNRIAVGKMRTALKQAREAVATNAAEAPKLIKNAVRFIDKAVTKGVIKRGTASRYISRLTRSRAG
jgi:small subunit ribosomal protein S20